MDWRDNIVERFVPGAHLVYAVSDPDGLLTEAEIIERVGARGFDVLPFEDPVAFRYAYETKYRRHWIKDSEHPGLIVRTTADDFRVLPYDVLNAGERVRLRLTDVFAGLHAPVLRALDPSDWDVLYRAVVREEPRHLNAEQTKDFVLRYVYRIDPTTLEHDHDLLHVLLRRHYSGRRFPPVLDDYLIDRLASKPQFDDWPLAQIIPDASHFYAFLQERWPIFLREEGTGPGVAEPSEPETLRYSGPRLLPFGHNDVRSYVDSLFLDRLLEPITLPGRPVSNGSWIRVGIRVDEAADRRLRFERLLRELDEALPASDAHHTEWQHFAKRWAALNVLRHQLEDEDAHNAFRTLRGQVDDRFTAWMLAWYGTLYSQPPPVMVHHVPRVLQRRLQDQAERVALLVIDGLALDQWLVLRNVILDRRGTLRVDERTLFAWVPTLTDVSRQAIFAGGMPMAFASSLGHTRREEKLWTRYWTDSQPSIRPAYLKVEGQRGDLDAVRPVVQDPGVQVLGIVFYQIDEMMHGMTMGQAGMHNQVRQWGTGGALLPVLDMLLEEGYRVFLTADHGNVTATGWGTVREGQTADRRGRRARVYPAQSLRETVVSDYPDAIEWKSMGLPEDFLPLLASGRHMFAPEGSREVVHGGLALEEVIVPFVEIT